MDPSTTLPKEKGQITLDQADEAGIQSEAGVMDSVQREDKEPIVPLETDNVPGYLHGFNLFIIMLALLLSMFLVWLILFSTPGLALMV